MEFLDDGRLTYTIEAGDKRQIIFLTYSIAGNQLVPNQPSAPQQEAILFELSGDRLELIFDGVRTRYRRT